ncbi:hypothetical protein T439DRAFT_376981 [Meredithblackwellia eburnea MCA 4105]
MFFVGETGHASFFLLTLTMPPSRILVPRPVYGSPPSHFAIYEAQQRLEAIGRLCSLTHLAWFDAIESLFRANNLEYLLTEKVETILALFPDKSNRIPSAMETNEVHLAMCLLEDHVGFGDDAETQEHVSLLVSSNPRASWKRLKKRYRGFDVSRRAGLMRSIVQMEYREEDGDIESWLDKFQERARLRFGEQDHRSREVDKICRDLLLANLPTRWVNLLVVLDTDGTHELVVQLQKIGQELKISKVLQQPLSRPPPWLQPKFPPPPMPPARILRLPPELLNDVLLRSLPTMPEIRSISTVPSLANESVLLKMGLYRQSYRTLLRLVCRQFADVLGPPQEAVFSNITKMRQLSDTLFLHEHRGSALKRLYINIQEPNRGRRATDLTRTVASLFRLTPNVDTLHVSGPVALYAEFGPTDIGNGWHEWAETRQECVFRLGVQLLKRLRHCSAGGRVDQVLQNHIPIYDLVFPWWQRKVEPSMWANLTTLSIRHHACLPIRLLPAQPHFQLKHLSITGAIEMSGLPTSVLKPLEECGVLARLETLVLPRVDVQPQPDRNLPAIDFLQPIVARVRSLTMDFYRIEESTSDQVKAHIAFVQTLARSFSKLVFLTLPFNVFPCLVSIPTNVNKVELIGPNIFTPSDAKEFPETLVTVFHRRPEGKLLHIHILNEDNKKVSNANKYYLHVGNYLVKEPAFWSKYGDGARIRLTNDWLANGASWGGYIGKLNSVRPPSPPLGWDYVASDRIFS